MVAVGMLEVGVASGALGQAEGGGVCPARARCDLAHIGLPSWEEFELSQLRAAPEGHQ